MKYARQGQKILIFESHKHIFEYFTKDNGWSLSERSNIFSFLLEYVQFNYDINEILCWDCDKSISDGVLCKECLEKRNKERREMTLNEK